MNIFDLLGYTSSKTYQQTSKTSAGLFALVKTGASPINSGSLNVALDGVIPSFSGNISHAGGLAFSLDSISILSSGTLNHTGSLGIILDDVTLSLSGLKTSSGNLSITLDDILFAASGGGANYQIITKGGTATKKRKHENDRKNIEELLNQAANKQLGIDELPEPAEFLAPEPVKKTESIDFTGKIRELELQANETLLKIQIEQRLIDAENDDEEAILMLMGF